MKTREFKVELSRKVEQIGTVIVEETSAQRARVVAEYGVKTNSTLIEWSSEVIRPTQLRSRVIED